MQLSVWWGPVVGLQLHVSTLLHCEGCLSSVFNHCLCMAAGLSVAAVISVQDGCLILGGADIVDGSPVLDVKPYLPYVDSMPTATAPDWVRSSEHC